MGSKDVEVLDKKKIHDWLFLKRFPSQQGNKAHDGDDNQGGNKVRSEPVIFLSLVQNDLQGAHAQGQERKSNEVEAGELLPQAGYVRWIFDKLIDQYERQNAHRNVDVENPAPRVVVCNPPSQRRTNGRSADGRNSIQRKGQPSLLGSQAIAQDGLRHRLQASSGCALHDSKQQQKPKAVRAPTEKGTDCKKCNADQKEALPPKRCDQPSTQWQNDRIGDQIAGQHPRTLVIVSRQTASDVWQSDIGDAGIEHLHERGQRNRARNDPWVDFGLPEFFFGGTRSGSAHRTLTSGSTDQPALSSPSHLKSGPAERSKSRRTGTLCTTFT